MGRKARMGWFKSGFGLILFIVAVPIACTRKAAIDDGPQGLIHDLEKRPVIIFVPGLYGSSLKESVTGIPRFMTTREAIFGNTPLGLDHETLGIENSRPLRDGGLLKHVSIFPGISIDVYGDSLQFFKSEFQPKSLVVELSYDWRLDILSAVRKLSSLIDHLRKNGAGPIALIGHSMGGNIIYQYLMIGDQDYAEVVDAGVSSEGVAAAVFAGVPFNGSATAFRLLQQGDRFSLSKVPLSPESIGSMPSFYQTLIDPKEPILIVPTHYRGTPVSFYDSSAWEKWNWGFLQEGHLAPRARNARVDYIRKQLERAKLRFNLLHQSIIRQGTKDKPVLVITGVGCPTLKNVAWAVQDGRPGRWIFDEQELSASGIHSPGLSLFADGDCKVTADSGHLPAPAAALFKVEHFNVSVQHSRMFMQREIQKKVSQFLHNLGF